MGDDVNTMDSYILCKDSPDDAADYIDRLELENTELKEDSAILNWIASHWDSQNLGTQKIFGRRLANPTGSFRDACRAAMVSANDVVNATPRKDAFVCDKHGRDILPGDTLKVFHHVGENRERIHMYKYVESIYANPAWNGELDALLLSHLSTTDTTCVLLRRGQRELDIEIVQGYGPDGNSNFRERPVRIVVGVSNESYER